MRIVGIESSCDESALAVFDPTVGLLGEWVHSQIERHKAYGGIVPDLASREHLENFPPLGTELFQCWQPAAGDLLAVTAGPGLAGCLALGMAYAHSLAVAYELPVVGVNHLRGHAFSPFIGLHMDSPQDFSVRLQELLPHLGLIVSGGNTLLFSLDERLQIEVLARTVDDAAGEALDKGAKLLGMPYPGGPLIEKLGEGGDATAFDFPRAFANSSEPRFSFSGLKTSLRYQLEKMSDSELSAAMPDLCASYQAAVVEALALKTRQFVRRKCWKSLGLSGGVANNKGLQAALHALGERYSVPVLIAQPRHTGDNAAMIAFAAWLDRAGTLADPVEFRPAWELS